MNIKSLIILIFLFLFSVVIRIPTLNRPLSDHHEWLTAHLLLTQRIWWEAGIRTYNFSLPYTFPGITNRNIKSEALGGINDNHGNYYYISYPPFSFIFPFFLFRIISIYPDVLPLQIINLIIHFVNAYFIYKIIALIINSRKNGINIPAFVGYAIYLFSPMTLWFQSNIYSEEILAQFFWISLVYLILCLSIRHKVNSWLYLILYFTGVFLLIYTDWTSAVLLIPVFLLFLYRLLKKERYHFLILTTIFACLLPIVITVYQYSQINGYDSFFSGAVEKYLIRSGQTTQIKADFGYNMQNPASYKMIFNNYKTGYLYVLIFLSFLVIVFFGLNDNYNIFKNNRLKIFTILVIPSVFIHHILFFNFTAVHDFSSLKSAIFISVISAVLYDQVIKLFRINNMNKKIIITNILFIILIMLSIRQFYNINSPLLDYSNRKKFGEAIAEAAKNRVVFVSGDLTFMEPQVLFYASRNILPAANNQEIYSFLKKYQQKQAIKVITKPNWKIEKIETIDIKDEK